MSEEEKKIDSRFMVLKDREKYYCPMCLDCGLCCLQRDWSIDWMGEKIGICGYLDIEKGECIGEEKKSILCRTFTCPTIDAWMNKVYFIAKRHCPTANKALNEILKNKATMVTLEEMQLLQEKINQITKENTKDDSLQEE